MESRSQRVLLFHRDYRGFTGGHLKVRDYYAHAEHATGFTPRIFFTHRSIQGPKNPWHGIAPPPLPSWRPSEAAALFVAGFDWQAVPDPSPAPVINLIQGVCHADDGDARHAFLSRRAVRICVSQEVADAICATGAVNGPVYVIPNGIDLGTISSNRVRDIGVFIAGLKNPTFAVALAALLVASGVRVDLSLNRIPRPEFLDRLSRANIVVALPCEREGFSCRRSRQWRPARLSSVQTAPETGSFAGTASQPFDRGIPLRPSPPRRLQQSAKVRKTAKGCEPKRPQRHGGTVWTPSARHSFRSSRVCRPDVVKAHHGGIRPLTRTVSRKRYGYHPHRHRAFRHDAIVLVAEPASAVHRSP